VLSDARREGAPLPLGFSQVFILKTLKVVCFHTLLQVLILNVVSQGLMRCRLEGGPYSNFGTDQRILLEQTSEGEVPTARGDDDQIHYYKHCVVAPAICP
jgi:hypothetical protein